MPRFSRRSFLHLSAAASAATAFQLMTEPLLAAAARRRPHAKDAVLIDSNENPLGPCQAARVLSTIRLAITTCCGYLRFTSAISRRFISGGRSLINSMLLNPIIRCPFQSIDE